MRRATRFSVAAHFLQPARRSALNIAGKKCDFREKLRIINVWRESSVRTRKIEKGFAFPPLRGDHFRYQDGVIACLDRLRDAAFQRGER